MVNQNPDSAQGRLSLAQAFAASDDLKNAIDTLEFIVNDEPRVAGVLAQYQEQAGLLKEATQSYTVALANDPMNRGLKFRRIAAAFNDGNYAQAAAFATDAQAQHPDDLRFPRLRARAIFEGGDPARAVTILEPTAKANPRDTATQLALADLYNDAGRDGDAERTLRQLLDVEPANAEALNYLGYLLANRGRSLDEAVRLVERALDGGAGQSGVPRQPGLGALPPRQPGRGREVSVAGGGAAAAQRGRPGSPGRRARPARPVGRCDHRLDARARGRRRHRPRAGRKENSGRKDEDTALRMINSQLPTPNSQGVGRLTVGILGLVGVGIVPCSLQRVRSRGSCRFLPTPALRFPTSRRSIARPRPHARACAR